MSRLGAVLLVVVAPALTAQQLSVGAARWLTSPHVTDYRLGVQRYGIGPFAVAPFGQIALQGRSTDASFLVGLGADVVVPLTADARPYLVGGLSAGFLDLQRTAGVGLWSSWSAGAGVELIRAGPVALGAELRYQALSRGTRGVSVGARLGAPFGRRGPAAPRLPPAGALAAPADGASSGRALRMEVVDAAIAAMGTPYRWGGTDGNGFDCSGLIAYAYGGVGMAVPRRSADQARVGEQVPRDVAALEPGDILAFAATPGGSVTHVGLYAGDGRFIHSASTGVQLSRLAADDPAGRWWVERWVGARRLLADR